MLIPAALVWMYGRTIAGLAVEWTSSPDASYGVVMAAAALVIVWHRRAALAQAFEPAAPSAPALIVLLGGLATYVVGLLAADVFLTRVSLVPVLAGIVWLLCGPRAVRVLTAPLAFALIAIPLPTLIVNAITLPLQFQASRAAEALLTVSGVPVFRDGNLLELPSTTLEVAEACSGLRSLVSLTAIAILMGWAVRTRMWRRCVIVAAALPIAVAMNGVRIAATGAACEAWGSQMATGQWHTSAGWLTFVLSLVVLFGVAHVVGDPRQAVAGEPAFV